MGDFHIFNTLTRSKEAFSPLKPGEVSLYTCGPTVYNFAHIGNLRTFIFYDVLARALRADGFDVKHVMNITDVGHLTDDADAGEDKMEKGAAREGKTVWEVADFYTEAFLKDMTALNIQDPTQQIKATDEIDSMIDLVKRLEEKGFTYKTSNGVYFDTSKLDDYGKLAKLDIEGLQEGARVEKNKEKKNLTDFALWKLSPNSESEGSKRAMEWGSPWGVGFPGWHLECSAMAMKYLGDTIDIHTGGIDHIPVHHTNEIAQSEAASGVQFARVWAHGEFLLVNEGRMGKSVGNFITMADVIEKGFSPLAYRYFVLGAHYRSKLNFTWKALEGAQQALNKLVYLVAQWDKPKIGCAELEEDFNNVINDDLNTSEALAVLWKTVKSDYPTHARAESVFKMDEILGLDIKKQADALRRKIDKAGKKMEKLLADRDTARENKDYEKSDAMRDKIAELGFVVEDTDEGSILRPSKK